MLGFKKYFAEDNNDSRYRDMAHNMFKREIEKIKFIKDGNCWVADFRGTKLKAEGVDADLNPIKDKTVKRWVGYAGDKKINGGTLEIVKKGLIHYVWAAARWNKERSEIISKITADLKKEKPNFFD